MAYVKSLWDLGAEGVILKRRAARYLPGKRSPDFVKVKKEQSALMTVVGFEKSRGEKIDRGPFATVVLEDARGNRTSVKTVDDDQLEAFSHEWADHLLTCKPGGHPAIGRKLWIEYQDWTPKGGYRHPRWDRWEE
jgi:bifunctional non-homologous end joining protein LigD